MNNKLILVVFFTLFFASEIPFLAQNNINNSPKIKELIAKKRAYNKEFGFGYRILLYYGNETKARTIQSKFKLNHTEVYSKLDYNQPYWEVHVGNYKTKLEADKDLLLFKEEFSGIIVIPMGR